MTTVAPPAKTALSDTYPNPSNATMRTGMAALYDYLINLLGSTGSPATARTALGSAASGANSDITSINGGPITGLANRLVNGCGRINQSGTLNVGVALTASLAYPIGGPDNWFCYQSTAANGFFLNNIGATGAAGVGGYFVIGRNNGNAAQNPCAFGQAVESNDSYFQSGKATLSFWAKRGATTSGGTLAAVVYFGQGTDQSSTAMISAGWTGQSTVSNSPTITTNLQFFQYNVTVPAGTSQVGVQFTYTPTGTAGADDGLYVSDIRLIDASLTGQPPEHRPYGLELSLCQRFLPGWHSSGTADVLPGYGIGVATTQAVVILDLGVKSRVPPTGIAGATVTTPSQMTLADGTTGTACSSTPTFNSSSTSVISFLANTASGLTQYRPYKIYFNSASGSLFGTGCQL